MSKFKYDDFHAWWDEIENYSTRGLRCLESMGQFQSDLGREANMILWLQAAFDSARLKDETDITTNS